MKEKLEKLSKILVSSLANRQGAALLIDILNEMNTDLKALTAKMDVDTGITATDYAATISDDNVTIPSPAQ